MRKTLLVFPGYCVGLGGLLLITYRTFLAIGSENNAITIQVNRFGEQYLDLICLIFLWIVCFVGIWSLSSLVHEKKSHMSKIAIQSHEKIWSLCSSSHIIDSFPGQHLADETGNNQQRFSSTDWRFQTVETERSEGLFSVFVVLSQEDIQG